MNYLKISFLLLTIICFQGVNAQQLKKFKSTKTLQYLDASKEEIVKQLPVYSRSLLKVNNKYKFRDYYIVGSKKYKQAEGFLNTKNEYVDTLKTYYESGQLKTISVYKSGLRDGIYLSYFESGQPEYEKNYKNDELFGSYKQFYESGKLCKESYYFSKDSVKHIASLLENGHVASETFKNSKGLDSVVVYRKPGILHNIVSHFSEDTKKFWYYYENGQVSRSYVESNKQVSEDNWYDEEGKPFKSSKEIFGSNLKSALDEHVRNTFYYPAVLQKAHLEARVFVNFRLQTDGSVDIIGSRTSGHPYFAAEAERIMRHFSYKEFTSNNLVVPVTFSYPIVFKLN